jgi:hypothetical protein
LAIEPAPAAARCVFSSTMSSKADLERRHGRDVRPCFPHVFRCVRKTGGSDLRCGIGEVAIASSLVWRHRGEASPVNHPGYYSPAASRSRRNSLTRVLVN